MIIPYLLYRESKRFGYVPPLDPRDNLVSDWLYGDWNEEKYEWYLALRTVDITGFTGAYFDYLLDRRSDSEYMRRNQLTFNDIHDPRKLAQSSSAERLGSTMINFVSRNITNLYKD